SSRRRHTRSKRDWSSDVCSSDLGRSGSYSTSEQQAVRDLLTPDEVRLLPDGKAVLFVRGERPVIDDKYNLLRHPCIRFTEDGGEIGRAACREGVWSWVVEVSEDE